jgi:hypothetical protein
MCRYAAILYRGRRSPSSFRSHQYAVSDGRQHRLQQLSAVASHAVVPNVSARVGSLILSIRGQLDQDSSVLARRRDEGPTRWTEVMQVESCQHLGRRFDTCGSRSGGFVIPYFIPSIRATVRYGQKRSATETPGSEPFRDCQKRAERALKRLLIRRFWVRNPGGARRSTRSVAVSGSGVGDRERSCR